MIAVLAPELPHRTHLPVADHFSVSTPFMPSSHSSMTLQTPSPVNQWHLPLFSAFWSCSSLRLVTRNDACSHGPKLSFTSVLPSRKFPASPCYSRVGPLIIHSDRHLISPSPSASISQARNMIRFLTFERTFPPDLAFPWSNHHRLL